MTVPVNFSLAMAAGGELTELLRKHPDYPGSNNGTGLLQIIVGLKMRETFERLTQQAEQLVTA